MTPTVVRAAIVTLLLCGWPAAVSAYRENGELERFVAELVASEGFGEEELRALFTEAKYQQGVIDAISRPAERTLEWREYREIFLTAPRIRDGVRFWDSHRASLTRAEREFGVPARIVVAIIGVETLYGQRMGRYRVIDALTTLAFDYPPRSAFFRKELREFLLLSREEGHRPERLLGSYAGAMGYGQFIPSSYRDFAVDFDGDGKRDIWFNAVDAIGSVANYLMRHGWQAGQPVTCRANIPAALSATLDGERLKPQESIHDWMAAGLIPGCPLDEQLPAQPFPLNGVEGTEYWLSLPNFYAITRYNHSELYAMAVYQLGGAIAESAATAGGDAATVVR